MVEVFVSNVIKTSMRVQRKLAGLAGTFLTSASTNFQPINSLPLKSYLVHTFYFKLGLLLLYVRANMDWNAISNQVSNLTLYDVKAGVRKVQNGKPISQCLCLER